MKGKYIKQAFFTILFSIILSCSYSQEGEKEPHYNYLSLGLPVYTNATGSLKEKLFMTVEYGKTFGIFDIGLMAGRLNFARSDTSWFTEILPTINVFSKGKFSEALTLGAGYVFNAKQNFLTEITNSINFAATNKLVLTVYQGNYFFDVRLSTSKAQFMGVSVTLNFIKKGSATEGLKKKSLLN